MQSGINMNSPSQQALSLTRRQLFGRTAAGLGTAALATLLGRDALASESAVPAHLAHFAPKAKRVIYMLHGGAPSHVDLFDYKASLEKYRGQQLPDSVRGNQRLTTMTAGQKQLLVLPGITKFNQYGQSGAWLCDFLPHTASIADDLCFIKSMHTEAINHAPAVTLFMTGAQTPAARASAPGSATALVVSTTTCLRS